MSEPTAPNSSDEKLPRFLRNSDAFSLHLEEKFSARTPLEKGDSFVAFACKVLPLCDFWGDLPPPEPNSKKTHDRGVDLIAIHPTTRARAFGQAKFRMREVREYDGVISMFAAHDKDLTHATDTELPLFSKPSPDGPLYVLVTSSDLGEIRRRYEDSRLPSLEFYRSLQATGRLQILDGPRLLKILQTLYRQSFLIQSTIELRHVSRIDLELARFLRPQVVREIARSLGYGASTPTAEQDSISGVLEEIRHTKISYDALKLLYIGLFSRYPSNMFEAHDSEMRLDVLHAASAAGRQEYVVRVLLQLLMQMRTASEEFKRRHTDEKVLELFKHLFREEQPRYNCLLGLLVACGCVNDDLAHTPEDGNGAVRWARIERFLGRLEIMLVRHREHLNRVFRHAVMALALAAISAGGERDDMLQCMSRVIESSSGQKFLHLVVALRILLDNDDWLAAHPLDLGNALAMSTSSDLKVLPLRGKRPPKLSAEALAARLPPPQEKLLNALQDRVHRDIGIVRPARSVKVRLDR